MTPRTTKYRDVILSRVKKDPYGVYTTTRTLEGKKLILLMGVCLKTGGDAQMETRYDEKGGEVMDLTLNWPGDA